MAIIDVVKFDGLRSRDWLVYKFPSDTLVFGTRLIVNEGQVAVFVKGGQVCDLFYPGSYILDTDNLPVLFHIFNLPYGGKSSRWAEISKAEIFSARIISEMMDFTLVTTIPR